MHGVHDLRYVHTQLPHFLGAEIGIVISDLEEQSQHLNQGVKVPGSHDDHVTCLYTNVTYVYIIIISIRFSITEQLH